MKRKGVLEEISSMVKMSKFDPNPKKRSTKIEQKREQRPRFRSSNIIVTPCGERIEEQSYLLARFQNDEDLILTSTEVAAIENRLNRILPQQFSKSEGKEERLLVYKQQEKKFQDIFLNTLGYYQYKTDGWNFREKLTKTVYGQSMTWIEIYNFEGREIVRVIKTSAFEKLIQTASGMFLSHKSSPRCREEQLKDEVRHRAEIMKRRAHFQPTSFAPLQEALSPASNPVYYALQKEFGTPGTIFAHK
jgi:hypothetical protein